MKEELSFEAKLKRLEEITDKLENEVLSLDDSLKLYEEGKKLISTLREELLKAEEAIKALQK